MIDEQYDNIVTVHVNGVLGENQDWRDKYMFVGPIAAYVGELCN